MPPVQAQEPASPMTRYRYPRYGHTVTVKRAAAGFGAALVAAGLIQGASHQPSGHHAPDAATMAIAAPAHYSSNEQLANDMAASGYGWTGHQTSCLDWLWTRESAGTWSPEVVDPDSGALGIPQALPPGKMASAGTNWQTSAVTQIRWGLGYISGRYLTPCNAWRHELQWSWY
jgi:hypothetical protein